MLSIIVQCFYATNWNFLQCWSSHPYWQGLAWLGHCHKCHKCLRVYSFSHGSSQCRFMSHFLTSILIGIFCRYTWLWNTFTALVVLFGSDLRHRGTFDFATDYREAKYSWSLIFLLDSQVTFRAKINHSKEAVTSLTSLTIWAEMLMLCALCLLTPDLLAHAFDPTLSPVHLLLRSCQLMNLVAYLDVSMACVLAIIFSPAMCTQQHVRKPGCTA